jgi:hypothetical protein
MKQDKVHGRIDANGKIRDFKSHKGETVAAIGIILGFLLLAAKEYFGWGM